MLKGTIYRAIKQQIVKGAGAIMRSINLLNVYHVQIQYVRPFTFAVLHLTIQ